MRILGAVNGCAHEAGDGSCTCIKDAHQLQIHRYNFSNTQHNISTVPQEFIEEWMH